MGNLVEHFLKIIRIDTAVYITLKKLQGIKILFFSPKSRFSTIFSEWRQVDFFEDAKRRSFSI